MSHSQIYPLVLGVEVEVVELLGLKEVEVLSLLGMMEVLVLAEGVVETSG